MNSSFVWVLVGFLVCLATLEIIGNGAVSSLPGTLIQRSPLLASRLSNTKAVNVSRVSAAPSLRKYLPPAPDLNVVPKCVPHNRYMTDLMNQKKAKWTENKMRILLLSAYDYDTHIIVTTESEGWYGKRVFCRYLSSNFTEIGPATAGMTFPEYSVNCCTRNESVSYISVTEKADDPIVHYVPVHKRNNNTFKYGLSMCLAPIYGNESTWLMMTEMIEHYKLQGVEHFYVYVHEMDQYSQKLLHNYQRTGEVEAAFLNWREDRPGKEWQLVGVMDCLHRSRFESKHVIFADLDERITPSIDVTLAEYAKLRFENNNKIGLLKFRPRWILRDRRVPSKYEGLKTLNSDLPTLVFHNTSHWPGVSHTSKCIVDPRKVLAMWVHYAHAYFPGFSDFAVPPEHAIIRHYRDVVISDWGTRWMPDTLEFGKYTYTDYPAALQEKLLNNVKSRLDRVYIDDVT